MKYCIPYKKDNPYLNLADEYIINYKDNKQIIDFIKENCNKRIIISIYKQEELFFKSITGFKLFKKIYQEQQNFVILLDINNCSSKVLQELQESKIPFFTNTAIDSFDELYNLIELGVSDIYITNELGFDLERVAALLHKNNINIRAFPNVCQTKRKQKDIFSFFIRPEDIDIYGQYINIIEFDYTLDEQIKTYLKIYNIDKKWCGDLSEIISNLDLSIDNQTIIKQFAETRVKCKKDCIKGKPCQICNKIISLAETLQKAELKIKN